MTAVALLERLDGVRSRGPDKWSARCPAHDDRSPSLSVRETGDGRVLLRCFAGCETASVLDAVGLTFDDLFPPRPGPGAGSPPVRRPWNASDLIDLAAFEAGVCVVITSDMLAGKPVDRDRLLEAAGRLADVSEAVHGRR